MADLILAPEDSLLGKETEIAILVENGSVFSLTNSLDRLLEAYGFESRYFYKTNDVSIEIFKDGYGNILTLEYDFVYRKEEYDDREILISGILVKPIAELYVRSLREIKKIDLRDYIKIYPENVFSRALEEIRERLLIKAKDARESNRIMYI